MFWEMLAKQASPKNKRWVFNRILYYPHQPDNSHSSASLSRTAIAVLFIYPDEHMSINYGCFDIFLPQQFFYDMDIVAMFNKCIAKR